jgi:hypothetical protein
MSTADRTWEEHRLLILSELKRLDLAVRDSEEAVLKALKGLQEEQARQGTQLTALQAKAGMLGFFAGLLASVGSTFLLK